MNFPEIQNTSNTNGHTKPPMQTAGRLSTARTESSSIKPSTFHFPQSFERVSALANKLEKDIQTSGVRLSFNVIESNNTIQVEVSDQQGNLIRKIPSDDMVKLSKSLRQHFPGAFLDKQY